MGPNDTRPLGDADRPESVPVEDEARFADEWDGLTIAERALWGDHSLMDVVRWLAAQVDRPFGSDGLSRISSGYGLSAIREYLNAVDRDAYVAAQIANLDDGADAAFEREGDR